MDADFVDPLTFHEVARRLTSRSSRKHALQLAVAIALVDGPPSDATRRSLRELAVSFGEFEQARTRPDYVAYARALLDDLQIPLAGRLDAQAAPCILDPRDCGRGRRRAEPIVWHEA